MLEEALQEPEDPGGSCARASASRSSLVDRRRGGELIGRDAAGDPAQVDVAEQARQDHRQHLVLERRRRQLADRVGPRHPRQQRLVARQLGCTVALAPGAVVPYLPGGAQAPPREHQPEVVDHHQRDPQPEPREQVPPTGRGDGIGRNRRGQLRVGQRRQLAPQLAIARFGVVRHPFRLHGGGRPRRTACDAGCRPARPASRACRRSRDAAPGRPAPARGVQPPGRTRANRIPSERTPSA